MIGWTLIRLDRQYPIFADIPEVLSTNSGRAGRTGAYSAVVEVIHLAGSGALPCQSIKRLDTVESRIGKDLREVRREYRLLQIIDPLKVPSTPSLPTQLGFITSSSCRTSTWGRCRLNPTAMHSAPCRSTG